MLWLCWNTRYSENSSIFDRWNVMYKIEDFHILIGGSTDSSMRRRRREVGGECEETERCYLFLVLDWWRRLSHKVISHSPPSTRRFWDDWHPAWIAKDSTRLYGGPGRLLCLRLSYHVTMVQFMSVYVRDISVVAFNEKCFGCSTQALWIKSCCWETNHANRFSLRPPRQPPDVKLAAICLLFLLSDPVSRN